jgi:hypothetical protein
MANKAAVLPMPIAAMEPFEAQWAAERNRSIQLFLLPGFFFDARLPWRAPFWDPFPGVSFLPTAYVAGLFVLSVLPDVLFHKRFFQSFFARSFLGRNLFWEA